MVWKLAAVSSLVIATASLSSLVNAQGAPPVPAAQGGAGAPAGRGRGPLPAAPPSIDLATARKALAAAEATAAAENARVAIVVVDANGDVVTSVRLDGAAGVAVTSAEGKARAAILFGLPTKQLQDAMQANQPVSVRITNPPLGAWYITPAQGGVPIVKDGKVVAAVGAGGAAPATDEKVAQAGADAAK